MKPDARSVADAVTARAAAFLGHGGRLLDELERGLGDPITAGLSIADSAGADAAELQQVNQQLVPLLRRLEPRPARTSWWRWFSGERLEHEVLFAQLQREIEALAARGERMRSRLQHHAQVLRTERARMAVEVLRLETDAAALRLMLTPGYAHRCRDAGLDAEEQARLSRRAAHLETMATATQLSRAQYKVTITHLVAVADRFVDVRAVLLPLWKQSMGFELFARRVADPAPFER